MLWLGLAGGPIRDHMDPLVQAAGGAGRGGGQEGVVNGPVGEHAGEQQSDSASALRRLDSNKEGVSRSCVSASTAPSASSSGSVRVAAFCHMRQVSAWAVVDADCWHGVLPPDMRARPFAHLAAACACRAEEIREVVGRMRRYRGNVVVQEQAAKMLRRYVEHHC